MALGDTRIVFSDVQDTSPVDIYTFVHKNMCCICVMCSAIDKSCSHEYHLVSPAVVPVIPDPQGEGHSKGPVHYTITLASSLLLRFYVKL